IGRADSRSSRVPRSAASAASRSWDLGSELRRTWFALLWKTNRRRSASSCDVTNIGRLSSCSRNPPRSLAMTEIDEMRRNLLISGAVLAAGIGLPLAASAAQPKQGAKQMNTITTKDGVQIYFEDWGRGSVVTFSHGWPLNADMWDGQ